MKDTQRRGRTDFNVRTGELYLALLTEVDPIGWTGLSHN